MTSIRMPRLMDRHLQEQERLQPLTLSLTLTTEGLSTARMTLGADAPRVAVQDFIELYSQQGSAGIFRVESVRGRWAGRARCIWRTACVPCGTAWCPGRAS